MPELFGRPYVMLRCTSCQAETPSYHSHCLGCNRLIGEGAYRDLLLWALRVISDEFAVGSGLAMEDEDCAQFQRALALLNITAEDLRAVRFQP